jgi:hypothetical protein
VLAEFQSLGQLREHFQKVGCSELIIKILSPNQDNSKNQIYLGKGLSLTQYFPGELTFRSPSSSVAKAHSVPGEAITAVEMNFYWLWPACAPSPAMDTKLIEYSQYPESRLSGFLNGSPNAPDALRREHQHRYGQRVLVLGKSSETVYGAVISQAHSPNLVNELMNVPTWEFQPLLRFLAITKGPSRLDLPQLLTELRSISGIAQNPQILRKADAPTERIPGGGQAGGWTLEALLGIPRNSASAPDKYGFEIKAVGGSTTSLITTEPDLGYRADNGVEAYLNKFGRQGQSGEGKVVFSGRHKCNQPNSATGAMLSIDHWDFSNNVPTNTGTPELILVHQKSGEVISGWSFAKLGQSWSKKHAGAIYVETKANRVGSQVATYTYGERAYVGVGTSVLKLYQQIATGTVFLDPGDTQHSGRPPHARTQWRIDGKIQSLLPTRLSPLYDRFELEII